MREKELYLNEGIVPTSASQMFRQELDALVPNPARIELSPIKEPPSFFKKISQPVESVDSRFESKHLDERNVLNQESNLKEYFKVITLTEPSQSISNAAAKVQTGLVMIESG